MTNDISQEIGRLAIGDLPWLREGIEKAVIFLYPTFFVLPGNRNGLALLAGLGWITPLLNIEIALDDLAPNKTTDF